MPTYVYQCDDCGEFTEFFAHMSEWNDLEDGQTPFKSDKCPKCGSIDFYRSYNHTLITETSPEQQQTRLKNQIAEDTKRVASGDVDFIKNLVGDKPINKKAGGQKYMKDVQKGAFKKK